uniref:HORMA domain-containing protein n=1 Tax=Pygocentrus nattereri TaxID=42514 RepID=A0A3B4C5A4_PYGNA
MACEQQLRTSHMLPRVVATEKQSLVVVKKLLAIAVSSITYLRGLFPEKAYGSKYVEEQKVMILREERTCPGASQIVQWLNVFAFACSSFQKVTECYQFRIQYTDKGPQLDFEGQKCVTKMECSDIKKASILLVRKLYTLMQNLGPLPDSVCLNMKLSYYDEVTPQDYHPPGFKEGDSGTLMFEKEPVNLTMGEVVTPFHTLKVDVTTERERLEQVLFEVDSLVKKTAALQVATMKTRSGRVCKSSASQFEFPLSQDLQPAAPKRRKFSVPRESH